VSQGLFYDKALNTRQVTVTVVSHWSLGGHWSDSSDHYCCLVVTLLMMLCFTVN